jgi:amino acid permease
MVSNKWVKYCIHGFTNISITTAFLGVSLGLFDFLADGFKRPNTRFGRFQTICLTLAPPLLVNILYPDSFLAAFGYSGIFVAILFLILPVIMVYRLRKDQELNQPSSYHVIFGKASFAVIIIFGFVLTVFPIMTNLGLFTMVK